MWPWKQRKRHLLPVSQNLSPVYFSHAEFQLVSCNLSLAMIWEMTYTHKLPKLCSATLKALIEGHIEGKHTPFHYCVITPKECEEIDKKLPSYSRVFVQDTWRSNASTCLTMK